MKNIINGNISKNNPCRNKKKKTFDSESVMAYSIQLKFLQSPAKIKPSANYTFNSRKQQCKKPSGSWLKSYEYA